MPRTTKVAWAVGGVVVADPGLTNVSTGAVQEKVTICHQAPGEPGIAVELTVGDPAVDTHLAVHVGDYVLPNGGRCEMGATRVAPR